MKLSKKIIAIILAAITILMAILTLTLTIMAFTALVELFAKYNGRVPGDKAQPFPGYFFGGIVGLIITIFIGITGGKGLSAAIKGKGEKLFNRIILNVCYFFIGITGATIVAVFDASIFEFGYDMETATKYLVWILVLSAFVITACILGTIARNKTAGPVGSHLTGGILLVITGIIMIIVIAINGAVDELKDAKVAAYGTTDVIDGLLAASTVFAYFASIGTFAYGVLNIVEGAIANHRGQTAPAKEEPIDK